MVKRRTLVLIATLAGMPSAFDSGTIPGLTSLIAYPCIVKLRGRCHSHQKYFPHAHLRSRYSHFATSNVLGPCRRLRRSADCSRKGVLNDIQPPRPSHKEVHERLRWRDILLRHHKRDVRPTPVPARRVSVWISHESDHTGVMSCGELLPRRGRCLPPTRHRRSAVSVQS